MRIAQIARKKQISPIQIIRFLERNHNFKQEHLPCTVIDEKMIDVLITHFEKNRDEIYTSSILLPQEKISMENNEDSEKTTDDNQGGLNIQNGIIKVPKIEIKGVKIVGKIDLEDKSKATESKNDNFNLQVKEQEESETITQTHKKTKMPAQRVKQGRKNKIENKNYTERSSYEKLKQEKTDYKNGILQKKEIEKKKKKAHYEKTMKLREKKEPENRKLKHGIQKNKNGQTTVNFKGQNTTNQKTWWSKFIYWLNH